MITWRPVNSSNVAAVGWPSDNSGKHPLLLIKYKDGRVYGYLGASRQLAVYLATRCDSVGGYVNKRLKREYDAVRIPELDSTGVPF